MSELPAGRSMEEIIDEFVRTYVTFRAVKCETHGDHLHWTFAPVIHDKPVPPEDMSIYVTGDGVQAPLGELRACRGGQDG